MASTSSMDHERRWEALRQRLESHQPLLAKQGTVARKRHGWTLRFNEEVDGRRVQRSISLSSDSFLVDRAERLILQWRETEDFEKETVKLAKMAIALGAALRRPRT